MSPIVQTSLVAIGGLVAALPHPGCTTLGPMPATTGIAFSPAGRPSGEIGFGVVPGYYLSSGVLGSPKGSGLQQGSLLLEPDRWLRVPGLVVGARTIGDSKDGGYLEPLGFAGSDGRVWYRLSRASQTNSFFGTTWKQWPHKFSRDCETLGSKPN